MFRILMLVITLVFILYCGGGDAASNAMGYKLLDVVYVKHDAKGDNNGVDWDNAFTDLQMGIDEAATKVTSGYVEVRVAAGTYKPTSRIPGVDHNDPRTLHFSLRNGVRVIGGYDPSGTSDTPTGTPSETVLSGDIGNENNDTDNVYHVFYHPSSAKLTSSAMLENVTITKGNANGAIRNIQDNGGGMYNNGASKPTLIKVNFESNIAKQLGGGMFNNSASKPTLTSVTFTGNTAKDGGGIANVNKSKPTLTDCTFTSNTATEKGGAIFSWADSTPTLNNVKGGADGDTLFTSGTSSTGDTKQNGYHQD